MKSRRSQYSLPTEASYVDLRQLQARFEELVVAFDESLRRGESPGTDESGIPERLIPRLRMTKQCLTLLHIFFERHRERMGLLGDHCVATGARDDGKTAD
jgi:hypothetical protein